MISQEYYWFLINLQVRIPGDSVEYDLSYAIGFVHRFEYDDSSDDAKIFRKTQIINMIQKRKKVCQEV